MRRRSIHFRVSDAEMQLLRAAAAADRRVLSDWVRIAALDAAMSGPDLPPRSIFREPPVERDRDWNEL